MTNDEDDDKHGDEECQRVARLNMLMMLKMVIDAGPVVIDAILMEQESPPFVKIISICILKNSK